MRQGTHVLFTVVLSVILSYPAHSEEPSGAGEAVILNIYDNQGGPMAEKAIPDWGYSALIEYRGKKILFDGGTSPVILENNAKALGVDFTEVDIIVLSHSHSDHTGGINHVVAMNPHLTVYVPYDFGFVSADADADPKLRKGHRWLVAEYRPLQETTKIAEGIHLIHTETPHTGVFWEYPPYEEDSMLFNLKELSLALTTEDGEVVLVVGCSHSGVGEIVKATKKALNAEIALVTGGFHLLPYSREYVADLARSMKEELKVEQVAMTHCTGDEAIEIFNETFGENALWGGLGARLTFPE